jgi:hypothetical protein
VATVGSVGVEDAEGGEERKELERTNRKSGVELLESGFD